MLTLPGWHEHTCEERERERGLSVWLSTPFPFSFPSNIAVSGPSGERTGSLQASYVIQCFRCVLRIPSNESIHPNAQSLCVCPSHAVVGRWKSEFTCQATSSSSLFCFEAASSLFHLSQPSNYRVNEEVAPFSLSAITQLYHDAS